MALALRLHTTSVLTWTGAVVALGLVMGAIAPNIGDMLDSSGAREMMQRLGGEGALAGHAAGGRGCRSSR